MSWLTDITSKAESFLNQIDQSAAQTLQNEVETPKSRIGEINVTHGTQIINQTQLMTTPPITSFNAYKHPAAASINRSAEAKLQSPSKLIFLSKVSKRSVTVLTFCLYRKSRCISRFSV